MKPEQVVLAIDLASVTSGWALFADDKFVGTGVVKSPQNSHYKRMVSLESNLSYLMNYNSIIRRLRERQIYASKSAYYVAYEKSDWINLNSPKREHDVMQALGMAKAVLILTAHRLNIPESNVIEYGAMYAKSQFGAKNKDDIAMLVAQELNLGWNAVSKKVSYGLSDLTDDETDAIALGIVASREIRQRRLIDASR